jgi:hypothetical protein
MGHSRPAINRNPPGNPVAGFVVFVPNTGKTRVKQTLAGQPANDVMPASALDLTVSKCAGCGGIEPTALVIRTGGGQAVTGHLCLECLKGVVASATKAGDMMITAKAGGTYRKLVALNPDGSMPDLTGSVPDQIENLIAELTAMVESDPARGTENEVSFLEHNKERTRQIGAALNAIGGHGLMIGVHVIIGQRFSGASARHLEIAWDGVGQWRA